MILDTSFIIDLMNSIPEAIAKFKRFNEIQEQQFVTTITIFELWDGITQSKKPEQEQKKVIDVLESQLILDFNRESAEEGGKIRGMLTKKGIIIDPQDCMIAGIAKIHGQPILTRNIKHFGKIHNIKIESY